MKHIIRTIDIGGRPMTIETGRLAKQASGSVTITYGETITLVTAVGAQEERQGVDFLPLSVEYQEKVYAAGRIPGNYFRREMGRPSEKETLTARIIDRPIRPLFPKGYRQETQVIATVLSMDQENDPDTLSMTGASAALCLSDIPFAGPVACVRVGRINGELVINPVISQLEKSDMNILVAGSKHGVVMVEGGGSFISEKEMTQAIFFAQEALQPILAIQDEMVAEAGIAKRAFTAPTADPELEAKVKSLLGDKLRRAMDISSKIDRGNRLGEIKKELLGALGDELADRRSEVGEIFHDAIGKTIRSMVLKEKVRIGNRAFDEIRPISAHVGILPRTHGSALFTRGETQVLGILTLGSTGDEQRVETLGGDESRPFMLHYNFPPYSVGEVRRVLGPSRRDIGHGGLSTRAIKEILPAKEAFDYTIRIVSEVLESNGSSSMATVCAASLALMDGGVPIVEPVSGIAMGLMQEGGDIAVLSDILGDEDHYGDMDFKVAGSKKGITSVQMDIKIQHLAPQILEQALEQALKGRIHIMEKMLTAISASRPEISVYAPKVLTIQIHPDKIRDIIGPGGKVIRSIQGETNTKIDIEDSGLVKVAAVNQEDGDRAIAIIREITAEAQVGEIYEGTVVKVTDFGAFVQIIGNTEGLCHISQLDVTHVKKASDVVSPGDKIRVKVLEISRDGKIRLSRKALLEEEGDGSGKSKKDHSGKRDPRRN
jgi:polyribonucleotide nucleotidyltransferase